MGLSLSLLAAAPAAGEAGERAAPLGAPSPPPFPPTHRPAPAEGAGRRAGPVAPAPPGPRVAAPVGSAERAVHEWLRAWHRRQLLRMATWSDAAWRSAARAGAGPRLAATYRAHRLSGWIVLARERAGTRAAFLVDVEFRTLLDPVARRRQLVVPVVREDPLGAPSERGRWGVLAARVHDASAFA